MYAGVRTIPIITVAYLWNALALETWVQIPFEKGSESLFLSYVCCAMQYAQRRSHGPIFRSKSLTEHVKGLTTLELKKPQQAESPNPS